MELKKLNKNGLYFSVDALIAVSLIFIVLLVYSPHEDYIESSSELNSDILRALSNLKVYEVDNDYVEDLLALDLVRDPNSTLLEQIGEYYTLPETINYSINMSREVLKDIDTNENIGLWFSNGTDDDLIFSLNETPVEDADNIDISRQFISGISKGQAAVGYAARAYLSSTAKIDYFYLGGYIGDGNISARVFVNGTINESIMELAINSTGNFSLYVNGINQANYTPSPSLFQPGIYNIPVGNFNNGTNIIELKGNRLSIAGGYIRVTSFNNVVFEEEAEKYFPGVDGIINVYDSFYVPNKIGMMNVTLHLNSSIVPTIFKVGDVIVWRNTTNGEQTINIDNATLAGLLSNFSWLNGSTIPIRIGIENTTFGARAVDVFDVSDLSGSMDDNCPDSPGIPGNDGGVANPGETPCKINDANNATKLLMGIILNYSGNRLGLAGFEDYARNTDFHSLSNNNASLLNVINQWNASGNTCICCGVLKAISCYEERIFNDNFNDQIVGGNPFGWSLSESGGPIDITSQSIEGNSAVKINTSGGVSSMEHIFAPQEDKVFVDFKFNQIYNQYGLVLHDNFNGQSVGTIPSGWNEDESTGTVRITSQSIEGNRAVKLNRTGGTISMDRSFNLQEGRTNVEFSFNHLTGTGVLRTEIRDSSDNDFIRLRTLGGQIQNDAGGTWSNVSAYSQNQNYTIFVDVLPGYGTYNLTINGVSYNNLQVASMRNNIENLEFYVETNNAAYLVDNVQVKSRGKLRAEIRNQNGNSYIGLRAREGQIQNNAGGTWTNVVAYNQNENYNISMLITPNTATYNLTINGVAYINRPVVNTRSNVGQIEFFAEYGNGTYLIDDLKVNLTRRLCPEINSSAEKPRYMIVMTDGEATRSCGLTGNTHNTTFGSEDAINASCLAYDRYNITVYTVGFDIDTPLSTYTLSEMAECGHGNYSNSDVNDLADVYRNIADQIVQTNYIEQSVSSEAYSRLYPDSHIDFIYQKPAPPSGLVFTLEKLFTNNYNGSFSIPMNSTALEVQIASYSGPRWTSKVIANGLSIFNLSAYGNDFTKLGDPYRINVPLDLLNLPGVENNFSVFTGTSPGVENHSSQYNKIIYRVAKNATVYTGLSTSAYGCSWTIAFEDGSVANGLRIPESYTGIDTCVYNQTWHTNSTSVADNSDVYQLAVFNLLEQIDIDSNGIVDFLFLNYKLKIFLDQVEGIPFEFSTEVQSRIWR